MTAVEMVLEQPIPKGAEFDGLCSIIDLHNDDRSWEITNDPAFADKEDSAAATTGMVDWILDHVYGDQITDDMPYSEAFRIATDTYAMTYGRETEVKN